MANTEIWHEIGIKASPAAVYRALTEAGELGKWWIPDTRGESAIGNILEFHFDQSCQRMQIFALEPDRLVRWRPVEKGLSDWADSEIEFEIVPRGDQSALRFRHFGLSHCGEALPYYSTSWAVFMLSLKQLVEDGEGFPFPNRWIHQ